jgi:hypothetical protein
VTNGPCAPFSVQDHDLLIQINAQLITIERRLARLEETTDRLREQENRRKGFIGAVFTIGSILGGIGAVFVGWILNGFGAK